METVLNNLEAVLCDPEGKCCISGTDEDRRIVDEALDTLREAIAQPDVPEAAFGNMDKEAMKKALDAIQLIFASTLPYDENGECVIKDKAVNLANEAIALLETALAQPVQPDWLLSSTQDLARHLARRCYPEVPQFEVLADLAGVISQIDNMTTGMERKSQPVEPTLNDLDYESFLAALNEPDDRMFEEIDLWTRQAYAHHRASTRGHIITAGDNVDSHRVWAALRWAKEFAQPVQPEQEPVAWQWLDTGNFRKKIPNNGECWRPLYASPPQRQPLTHEQRFDLLTAFEEHKHGWKAHAILIDMIEAAHNIRETT